MATDKYPNSPNIPAKDGNPHKERREEAPPSEDSDRDND